MKPISATILGTALLGAPVAAQSATVTLNTTLNAYGGPGAYLSLYVTDASGKYMGSLWMAGGKAKYYSHLTGWYQATRGNVAEVNGITGASVGAGQDLSLKLNLSDAIFDQGYVLHIDSSVENWGDMPNDVVIPLDSSQSGKAVAGKRFVRSFSFTK